MEEGGNTCLLLSYFSPDTRSLLNTFFCNYVVALVPFKIRNWDSPVKT